jgi:ABC-type siderophore export system fused ATPase/permease subunit
MTGPIAFIVNSNQAIARGLTSVRRLQKLNLSPPRELSYDSSSLHDWDTIKLEKIEYKYKTKDSVFHFGPMSFKINRGECYFVVGGNGSGKSTLAQLLTGLIQPDRGQVYVNEQKLNSDKIHEYRNLSSSVFFDVYLFHFFLNKDAQLADDEQIMALAKAFDIDHKIVVKQGRISDTLLSQGQKKRIALIQSMLQDKDILLFDEVAADQDPVFKKYFYHTLLPQLKQRGKTLLVISHDDRYFDCADHLLKMEDGKLVNQFDKENTLEQVV